MSAGSLQLSNNWAEESANLGELSQQRKCILNVLTSCCHRMLIGCCLRFVQVVIVFGMPCSSFSTLQNMNHGKRNLENPGGDCTLSREVLGNRIAEE